MAGVKGTVNTLNQLACSEAGKKLHQSGASTDNLVPDIVADEADAPGLGCELYVDNQANYFPPELVGHCENNSTRLLHLYLIELERNFEYNAPLHHIALAVMNELEFDDEKVAFDLELNKGILSVRVKHLGIISLSSEQVLLCQRFQITLFRVLFDHNLNKLKEVLGAVNSGKGKEFMVDYLLLPCSGPSQNPSIINWKCVSSVIYPWAKFRDNHTCGYPPKCSGHLVHTKNDLVCSCMLENSLVLTPHSGSLYCITGTLDNLDGNSLLRMRRGEAITYKQHYKLRHGIDLCFEGELLLKGKPVFPVKNWLQRLGQLKERGSSNSFVELPPELCVVIMSPISIGTIYSFSFLPSIMHRIECLLLAINLKKMHADCCTQNVIIPTAKVLEAITTAKCQEEFNLKSLATLGDSFLKYASSQQLFKTYQNENEGLLNQKREEIISNPVLCRLGCNCKLSGFIRNELFDPKMWIIPGDRSGQYTLDGQLLSARMKVFNRGRRKVKSKKVADAVEALIGASLSTGGEKAALSWMDWLGIKVDLVNVPYVRQFQVPKRHVDIKCLESLLNYSFLDPSLLVEALTHGSYIPRCYQRLEFLGDSVLDYLITMHLYRKYPGMSPGLLTDLRSASVNNACYALSALKAGLHTHILHSSQVLHRRIDNAAHNFERLSSVTTFGWESETTLPKVLADIIESIAGAILVDSGYNKDAVFKSIRPFLEPLVTPETLPLNPIRELNELCQREHFAMKKAGSREINQNLAAFTIEVKANGAVHTHTRTASDNDTAKRLASKAVLKSLKESLSRGKAEEQISS